MRRIRDLVQEFQLRPYDLLDSGNGTQYRNYLNDTVFTVYHDRLDSRNIDGVEVAIGLENASRELNFDARDGIHWLNQLVGACPQATSKAPIRWPRVALLTDGDVGIFERFVRALYSTLPRVHEAPEIQTAARPKPSDELQIDEWTLASIKTRRGQLQFRAALMQAYGGACAVTGCQDEPVLEAAHIVPHAVAEEYRPSNGLLLRADVHALFDLQLISANPGPGTIVVASNLGPTYRAFHGLPLRLPTGLAEYPDHLALMRHYQAWRARGGDDA